ncbi:hypothetical protein ACFW9F_19650, partial [Streptomyces sp. NPDC059506]
MSFEEQLSEALRSAGGSFSTDNRALVRGGAERGRRIRRRRHAAVAGGVAAVVLAGGGGVVAFGGA